MDLDALRARLDGRLLGLTGAPGVGKSTLAARLASAWDAVVVPMDGFHLDNRILDARGLRPRKGAPESFDAEGFVAAMRRLASESAVVVPAFERDRDIAIAGAVEIGPQHRVAIVEGNYLLLDAEPWRCLAPLWSLAVFLDPGTGVLHDRLVQRWLDHGLDRAAAVSRAEGNDLRNAATVRLHRVAPAAGVIEVT